MRAASSDHARWGCALGCPAPSCVPWFPWAAAECAAAFFGEAHLSMRRQQEELAGALRMCMCCWCGRACPRAPCCCQWLRALCKRSVASSCSSLLVDYWFAACDEGLRGVGGLACEVVPQNCAFSTSPAHPAASCVLDVVNCLTACARIVAGCVGVVARRGRLCMIGKHWLCCAAAVEGNCGSMAAAIDRGLFAPSTWRMCVRTCRGDVFAWRHQRPGGCCVIRAYPTIVHGVNTGGCWLGSPTLMLLVWHTSAPCFADPAVGALRSRWM
jgi:hypothetical protein